MTDLGQSIPEIEATKTGGAAGVGDAPRIAYVPALDGLRGLAVAAVVAFHVGHLEGGYLGVDLFFVLSGYLITSLLLAEEATTDRIKLVRFWGRRARRLLPALAVMLLGVAAYARFVAAASELHRIRWDGIATMLYVANWREVFSRVNYWSLFDSPSPLNHTWSLAIEEQFYLVWPLIFTALAVLARRHVRSKHAFAMRALVVSLLLGAASLAAAAWLGYFRDWNRVYFGTDTRAFAILAGAVVAAASARFGTVPEGRPRQGLEACGLLGVVVLAVAWLRLADGSPLLRHGGLAACSVAAAVVIAAVSHPRRGPLAAAFAWKPLRWLGLISYGVYLYHWPVIVWLDATRTGLSDLPLVGLQIAVTLALATASYFLIEQPVRHGRRWSRRAIIGAPALGFTIVAIVLIAGTAGYRPLSAPVVAGPSSTIAPSADGARIMVIGDSVADLLTREGLTRLRADPQPAVLNRAVPACSEPPTTRIRYPDGTVSGAFAARCDQHWARDASDFDPDYVLFTTAGSAAVEYWHDGRWVKPCSATYHDWIVTRVQELAEKFEHGGATLAVTTAPTQDRRDRPEGAYEDYIDANICWNDALRDAAGTSSTPIVLVDLAEQFCVDDRSCRSETADGSTLRPDGVHYRGRSAQIVGRDILRALSIDATLP
ncbi:MAG TPA: acyltransferase [Acidimicrobiales bacterium]|nr:acyltransferase [Acidimicrobiales bacterium]